MQGILRRWSEPSGNNFPPQSVLAREIGSSSLIRTGSEQGRNREWNSLLAEFCGGMSTSVQADDVERNLSGKRGGLNGSMQHHLL
jgi:hypothetical protein